MPKSEDTDHGTAGFRWLQAERAGREPAREIATQPATRWRGEGEERARGGKVGSGR